MYTAAGGVSRRGGFVSLIAAGIYLQPGVSTPSPRQTGDATIVSFLTPFLSGARGSVAVAFITPKACSTRCGTAILQNSMKSPA
jgi:hypothetical protein